MKKASSLFECVDRVILRNEDSPSLDGLFKAVEVGVNEMKMHLKAHHCRRLWSLQTSQDVEFFVASHAN